MKTIVKSCQFCKKHFEASLKEHKRGNGLFCSRSCASKFTRWKLSKDVQPNCTCAICNASFYRSPSDLKQSKSGIYFCSKKCKGQAQRLGAGFEIMLPSHYGAASGVESKNYRSKALAALEHKCYTCGWQTHPEVLEVHHKDGNSNNHVLENLQILCPTCHDVHHFLSKTGKYSLKRNSSV